MASVTRSRALEARLRRLEERRTSGPLSRERFRRLALETWRDELHGPRTPTAVEARVEMLLGFAKRYLVHGAPVMFAVERVETLERVIANLTREQVDEWLAEARAREAAGDEARVDAAIAEEVARHLEWERLLAGRTS